MTDIHTHILPGVDDGAATLQESLDMLKSCQEQGVDTVVLTPHFYPWKESLDAFLERREEAFQKLTEAAGETMPRLVLGAEVAWCPNLDKMSQISKLTMGKSNRLLLEMPMTSWSETMLEEVYRLYAITGVEPILAHVERYTKLQRSGQIEALKQMGVTMQLSAHMFLSPMKRRRARSLLRTGNWLIGSDCHDPKLRPPCLGAAVKWVEACMLENPNISMSWQP